MAGDHLPALSFFYPYLENIEWDQGGLAVLDQVGVGLGSDDGGLAIEVGSRTGPRDKVRLTLYQRLDTLGLGFHFGARMAVDQIGGEEFFESRAIARVGGMVEFVDGGKNRLLVSGPVIGGSQDCGGGEEQDGGFHGYSAYHPVRRVRDW